MPRLAEVSGIFNSAISHRNTPISLNFRIFENDVVVSAQGCRRQDEVPRRGDVSELSAKSRRRARLYLRNIISRCQVEAEVSYPADYPVDGRLVQRHFAALQCRLRRRGVLIFWMKEFQERGAPHIHFLADRFISKKWLARSWFEIVGSGDPRHEVAGTHVAAIKSRARMVSYMVSYMTKAEQKKVPIEYKNIGRFWGYSRALLVFKQAVIAGCLRSGFRSIRFLRLWKAACLRSIGFNWRRYNQGFVAWGCSRKIYDLVPVLKGGDFVTLVT